jgi:hypothetical protein
LQTKQETILSVVQPEFTVTQVSETRTIEDTVTTQTFGNWYDPLAQSFIVDSKTYKEGLFLTSIDLYFSRKGKKAPVSVYIVTTENGYPTAKVVPFSRVAKQPDEVNISSNATAATTFTFENPVYLQADGEYAFIVRSPDPEYHCWTAILDPQKTDITTGLEYSIQDHLGVFFTSGNAATWTAVQNQDLKFVMRRAEFTSNIGTMKFIGDAPTGIDKITLSNKGSKYTSEPTITFSAPQSTDINIAPRVAKGVAIIDTITGKINSIKITDKGNGYTSAPTITIGPPPAGGTQAVATAVMYSRNISSITCAQNNLAFDSTSIKNELVLNNQTTKPILLVLNKSTDVPKGLVDIGSNIFGFSNPCYMTTTITSSDKYISPVIDITRNSLLALENIINSESTLIHDDSDTDSEEEKTVLISGKSVKVKGLAKARYLTQPIKLDNPADKVNIFLNINRPTATSNVRVYIRSLVYNGDDTNIYDNEWTRLYPVNAKKEIPVNSNVNKTSEVEFIYDPDGDMVDTSNDFTTFQIKIVLVSNNIIEIPTVKDFRAIASI